tara:strand:- start:1001 stop:1303 length:303 start_codon:yes stop_codon:yes gene_type:complete
VEVNIHPSAFELLPDPRLLAARDPARRLDESHLWEKAGMAGESNEWRENKKGMAGEQKGNGHRKKGTAGENKGTGGRKQRNGGRTTEWREKKQGGGCTVY